MAMLLDYNRGIAGAVMRTGNPNARAARAFPAGVQTLTNGVLFMPTFDTVCKPDMVELRNAVEQSNKEIGTRFDFKGSDAKVEQTEKELTIFADSDFQLDQVRDVLLGKMTKRKVDVRFLDMGKVEKMGMDKAKQVLTVRNGVPQDNAKKIVAAIKNSKIKVQASIQGDVVRVQGKDRDDLQAAIALLKKEITDLPLGYENFRD
jgi:uncharacterized protein YajQ (UPF0234 family)